MQTISPAIAAVEARRRDFIDEGMREQRIHDALEHATRYPRSESANRWRAPPLHQFTHRVVNAVKAIPVHRVSFTRTRARIG